MSTTFNLDVWVREAKREPFRFTLADHEYSMPAAGELDKAILSKVNLSSPSAADIETLLKAGLNSQWARFNEEPAPIAALGELFRQWQAHEGAPLGEHSASADS
ncbi:hypothetical protein [Streptomyces erythrochromogenes]|uniref:hypothetical protein n=1 Tax=Streptomyces erythrochromogenes TaxID=285574 RepID=UPI003420FA4F